MVRTSVSICIIILNNPPRYKGYPAVLPFSAKNYEHPAMFLPLPSLKIGAGLLPAAPAPVAFMIQCYRFLSFPG